MIGCLTFNYVLLFIWKISSLGAASKIKEDIAVGKNDVDQSRSRGVMKKNEKSMSGGIRLDWLSEEEHHY